MGELRRTTQNRSRDRFAAWERPVTLRRVLPADLVALERLAQLDSRALPTGPYLVAERDGRIDAALSLSSGELIADPFRRTVEVCDLLRCHAGGQRVRAEAAPTAPLEPKPRLVTA
jgi:hypothetical protein